jgi:hypothetical protein
MTVNGGIVRRITFAVLAAAVVPLAACGHSAPSGGTAAGQSAGGGAASSAPAQSATQPAAGGSASTAPGQPVSHSGGHHGTRCPLTHGQANAALQTSTDPMGRNLKLGNLCAYRTSKSNSFALGVTIQRFPLPGQTIKTLSQAYTQLTNGSADQVTREPSWGSGAFLDVTSTPDFSGYTGYIPGYKVQLNVPIEDEARTQRASQILQQLISDVQH